MGPAALVLPADAGTAETEGASRGIYGNMPLLPPFTQQKIEYLFFYPLTRRKIRVLRRYN